MRVLLVDGFVNPAPLMVLAREYVEGRGHTITPLQLNDAGFGRYMSAEERAAYHDADNLITDETRQSAQLVRSHDALLVCGPMVEGAISPLVKSWFERVFVPEVSFTFTKSGRVKPALTNIKRVGMVVECPENDRRSHSRQGSARSVMRAVRLSASRRCRTTYLPIGPSDDPAERLAKALRHW